MRLLLGSGGADSSDVNWPIKWLVAFGKAKAVGPGKAQAVAASHRRFHFRPPLSVLYMEKHG